MKAATLISWQWTAVQVIRRYTKDPDDPTKTGEGVRLLVAGGMFNQIDNAVKASKYHNQTAGICLN